MTRIVLILSLVLAGCGQRIPYPSEFEVQAPVLFAPFRAERLSRPYTYLCADGRVVVARYDSTRWAQLQWDGMTFVMRRNPDGWPGPREDRWDSFGYETDDLFWHRHGAEALMMNGAQTVACRLTDAAGVIVDVRGGAPAGIAAPVGVVRDAFDPGGGKGGKL